MSLTAYTLKMAAIAAPVAALLVFGDGPLPTGWLTGIVDPGATIAKDAVVVGMWAAGAATTAGGAVGIVCLCWMFWRERSRRDGPAPRR